MDWLPRRARREAGSPADHEVTLLTRVGCHLCEVADTELTALAAELGFTLTVHDVDADPALLAAYSDRVPVVLLDGREHGFWRVESDRLRAALGASGRGLVTPTTDL